MKRLTHFLACAMCAGLLVIVGCAEPAEAPEAPQPMAVGADTTAMAADTLSAPPSLADTRWRLMEFQSMDDSVMQPQDDVLYTMDLGADGRVAMQLNCNRGSGTWTAEPGPGDATVVETGSFAFSPLAVTSALCPPPSMDEKIARDVGYVRGYHLRGDTLSLSLMADGGLYLWTPYDGDV